MKTQAITLLKNEVLEKGYAHIPNSENFSAAIVSSCFGKIIQTTSIKENIESSRLLTSHQAMDFHTDHFKAKFIAWHCRSQSAKGGDSLLIDVRNLLHQFSPSLLSLLQEITVNTHQIFYDDKLALPLLQKTGQNSSLAIYYAPWLVNVPQSEKHIAALQKFEAAIKSTTPIKLLLSEGDWLIINNHRMLHGRAAFSQNSNRWLTRFWLN